MLLGTLLSTLGASLLGNLLLDKVVKAKRGEHGVIRAGDGVITADVGTIRVGRDL